MINKAEFLTDDCAMMGETKNKLRKSFSGMMNMTKHTGTYKFSTLHNR